jgi:hypothetical protein
MTTRALVVGINAYASPNTLPSCVQDAQSFSELLATNYGFGDVKTLTDDQATKAGVLSGLQWLFAQSAPGDQLVFFYSGHGYQPMVDGELREALVTQDSQFLDDTELATAMASVPNGVLSIVLDTCFSGGLEKLFIDDKGAISHVVKSKYWTPLPSTAATPVQDKAQAKTFRPFGTLAPTASKGFVPAGGDATVTSLQLPASKGLLMSAAQADETASASTPTTKGLSAFTYALLDAVNANGAGSAAIALIQAAGATLHRIGLRQTPAIKQPITPPGMGSWSFLTLQPLQPSSAGVTTGMSTPQPLENSMTSTSFPFGSPATFDKGWLDSITGIVSAVVPAVIPVVAQALQSKGFVPQAMLTAPPSPALGSAGDKGWLDSIAGIVSAVVPAVIPVVAQALQSKGFVPQTSMLLHGPVALDGSDKGWNNFITGVVGTVVPAVIPIVSQALQSKGFVPQASTAMHGSLALGGQADKGWLDSITSIVNAVVPAVIPVVAQALQSKGFVPQAGAATPIGIPLPSLDDKGWLDVVASVTKTVAPIAIAML